MNSVTLARFAPTDDEPARAVSCDYAAIHQGDFVDIGVSVEIVTVRTRDSRPRVDVHFNLEHVLLLRSGFIEEVSTQLRVGSVVNG